MKILSRLAYPLFFLVLLLSPLFLAEQWLAVATTFLVFSVVSLSEDIILGKGGMYNMGHALFFGLGAYTTAILNVIYKIPILYTIPLSIAIPVLFGLLLAGPIVHLRGDYLLVGTLGFNIVFVQILENNLFGLTGGPNGLYAIDHLRIIGFEIKTQNSIYLICVAALLLTLWILNNLASSKTGRALHFLREDHIAAQSNGINLKAYKIFAFGLGAGIAGLAGTLYTLQYSAVSPESFGYMQSVIFLTIVIVGGSSIPGVLIGCFVMFVLPEIFREFATWRYFVFGFALIATMILRPLGIWPAKFDRIPKYYN
jgi:branched-chain amino acid transport system permease protein